MGSNEAINELLLLGRPHRAQAEFAHKCLSPFSPRMARQAAMVWKKKYFRYQLSSCRDFGGLKFTLSFGRGWNFVRCLNRGI